MTKDTIRRFCKSLRAVASSRRTEHRNRSVLGVHEDFEYRATQKSSRAGDFAKPSILRAKQLSYSVGKTTIIQSVSVDIIDNAITAIIGPNGAGKSTLLHLLVGEIVPNAGSIDVCGQVIHDIDRLSLAQRRAVLPQLGSIPFALSVYDIVAMGREPHRFTVEKSEHEAVIAQCLEWTDITDFATKTYQHLSGGEQHRVQLARTLAQVCVRVDDDLHGQMLFLDEPTNHLDILHQYRLMELLHVLKAKGLTIVLIMHDLAMTLSNAEHIILLNQGEKVGTYTPESLIRQDALSSVYGLRLHAFSKDGQYFIMPQ